MSACFSVADNHIARYEKAAKMLKQKSEDRNSRIEREKAIRIFVTALEKQPFVINEWDDRLWMSLLEKVTVYNGGRIMFLLKNGNGLEVLMC